jgi:phosphoglycolate phosphatase
MVSTVIFDLDGTLADSKDLLQDVFINVMKKRLPKNFSKKDLASYTDQEPQQIVKLLGINKLELIYYLLKGRRRIKSLRNQLKPIKDIQKVLKYLKSSGVDMYVASSNSKLVVDTFLRNNHIDNYFIETWGRLGLFSKSKGLNKIMAKLNIDKESAIYVGDEIKDVNSCRQTGIRCISVGWGLNSMSSLERANPSMVVSSVDDLIKKLKIENKLELQVGQRV